MTGHLGAVLTSGLAAVALALALLQAAVVAHAAPKHQPATAARTGQTNRYSAPGGRSAIPWTPSPDKAQKNKAAPENPEGSTPPQRQQDEHRTPPPPTYRGAPPRPGPQPVRKAAA
jgi:hypothetical protein